MTTCEDVRELLSEYVDGELPPSQRPLVAEHLLACTACRDEEQSLRELVKAAGRLPQTMAPAQDLWPGIAARIDRRVLTFADRSRTFRPATLAAAASLLVALTSAVTWRIADKRGDVRPAAVPAMLRPAALTTGAGASDLLEAERDYARATSEFLAVIDSHRSSFSPETLGTVEQNLRAIDQALKSLRTALKDDPGNDELTQLLAATHRRKVDTLRRVVRLSKL